MQTTSETETLVRLKYGLPNSSNEFMNSLPHFVIDRVMNMINLVTHSEIPPYYKTNPKLYIQFFLDTELYYLTIPKLIIVALVEYHSMNTLV